MVIQDDGDDDDADDDDDGETGLNQERINTEQ